MPLRPARFGLGRLMMEEEAMDGKRAGKLLLVEDEHNLRSLVAHFLRTEGFEVVEAADGAEGVGFYRDRGPFDVILLDLNLPMLCGVEVCRQIKIQNPGQPVIICSAAILDCDFDALADMQVRQFLTKPFHPLELLARISGEMANSPGTGPVDVSRGIHPAYGRTDARHRAIAPSHVLVKASSID
jgi:DNA-binding response OmpR family regulator